MAKIEVKLNCQSGSLLYLALGECHLGPSPQAPKYPEVASPSHYMNAHTYKNISTESQLFIVKKTILSLTFAPFGPLAPGIPCGPYVKDKRKENLIFSYNTCHLIVGWSYHLSSGPCD